MKKLLPVLLLAGCVTKQPMVYQKTVTVTETESSEAMMAMAAIAPQANMLSVITPTPLMAFSVGAPEKRGMVDLAWNASSDPTVVGYRVWWGIAPGTYTNSAPFGLSTKCRIIGLDEGVKYYFAATAFNEIGDNSDYSNEVSYTTPYYISMRQAGWYIDAYGAPGKLCRFMASTNLSNWVEVGRFTGDGKVHSIYQNNTGSMFYRLDVQ